jgi:hypothetical protein
MKINIICDFLLRPEYRKKFDFDERAVYLSSDSKHGNVHLDFDALARDLKCQPDPVTLDFCEIAAYVYLADKAIPRGEFDNWARDLSFLIPVRNPAKWNLVKQPLRNVVATLTGDNVQFHFVKRRQDKRVRQNVFTQRQGLVDESQSDSVCLFSGGLDSFAGAVYLLQQGLRLRRGLAIRILYIRRRKAPIELVRSCS